MPAENYYLQCDMLDINPTKQVQKFIKKLPSKQQRQLAEKIDELCQNPKPNDHKKMKGSDDTYRVDQGEYRIVYRFDKTVLYLLIIEKRNDSLAYKKYARMIQAVLLGMVG